MSQPETGNLPVIWEPPAPLRGSSWSVTVFSGLAAAAECVEYSTVIYPGTAGITHYLAAAAVPAPEAP